MVLNPRESGKFVANNAKHVSLHEEGIAKLSNEVLEKLKSGVIKMDIITQKECELDGMSDEKIADWVMAVDTLNYCFWTPGPGKWEVAWKGSVYTGYFALCAAISRAMEKGIDFTDPHVYSKLTRADIEKIFKGKTGKKMPLLEKRVECLQQVGRVLIDKFNGSFANCILEANGSAKQLLNIITSNFKCFDDVAIYQDQKVSFHKRAQIVVADLWTTFNAKGLGSFSDIDCITMFADYRVPQVLVYFGAMSYDEELLSILNQQDVLANGSEYEVEIRGCSVEAVERVVSRVKSAMMEEGLDLLCNPILVDNYLWKYRRDNARSLDHIPFHRVQSVYY